MKIISKIFQNIEGFFKKLKTLWGMAPPQSITLVCGLGVEKYLCIWESWLLTNKKIKKK